MGDLGLRGKSRMNMGKGDEDDGVRGNVIGRGGISGGRR